MAQMTYCRRCALARRKTTHEKGSCPLGSAAERDRARRNKGKETRAKHSGESGGRVMLESKRDRPTNELLAKTLEKTLQLKKRRSKAVEELLSGVPSPVDSWPEDERTMNPDESERETARQDSPRVGDVLRLIRSLERTGGLDAEASQQIRKAAIGPSPYVGGEIACDTCGKVFSFVSAAHRNWDRCTDPSIHGTEDNEVWFHSGPLPVGDMWECLKSVVGIFYPRIPGFYCREDCATIHMGGWLIPRGFERGQEREWRRK